MLDFHISLPANVALFFISGVIIGISGIKAAVLADRLADKTGIGEALTGTIFLGFLTALPGLLASVVAAYKGYPALAISNAIGGIAMQTVSLAIADIAYPRANLEHAAASVPNIMQTTMLITLMVFVIIGLSSPEATIGPIHPVTILLIITAVSAFWLVVATRDQPMWKPRLTDETVVDEPEDKHQQEDLHVLLTGLLISATLCGTGGVLIAECAENIVKQTGFSEVIVGGLFMAFATSLPELVTCIAAVRRGALTLAVSDIVGGNFFDVLFVAAADFFYMKGSIYHADSVGLREIFLTAFTVLLNVILLSGLIFRQKRGLGNIGFESILMIMFYLGGFIVLSNYM